MRHLFHSLISLIGFLSFRESFCQLMNQTIVNLYHESITRAHGFDLLSKVRDEVISVSGSVSQNFFDS